ncbi:Death-inducer obliterator 1 [Chionoecetes opilio]|uniref:Death-inducer obliterator 1 n=1 Tax=Chionoecetes opilio TaxID=41210 RepID=A0A8J4XY66_CHIOP|nr:Death-inducer obliterator 1 [Chionoecetes opilio]
MDIYGCFGAPGTSCKGRGHHGRQPHVEGDCMIACDACQTWYHRDCEGISSHRWRNLQDYDTTYTCNSCRSYVVIMPGYGVCHKSSWLCGYVRKSSLAMGLCAVVLPGYVASHEVILEPSFVRPSRLVLRKEELQKRLHPKGY